MIEKSVVCSPVRQNLRKSVQSITLPIRWYDSGSWRFSQASSTDGCAAQHPWRV